jgi:hypothetical protein
MKIDFDNKIQVKFIFKTFIWLYAVSGIGGVICYFLRDALYGADIKAIVKFDGHGAWLSLDNNDTTLFEVVLYLVILFALLLHIYAVAMLYRLQKKGKYLYLQTLLVFIVLSSLFIGVSISLPLELFLNIIASFSQTAIVFIGYFSVLKDDFK